LLVAFVISEIFTYKIGGDTGAFAYVTMHFVVMPLCSVYLSVLTIIRIYRCRQAKDMIVLLVSLVIPITIFYFGISGNILIPKLLKSTF